jgi:hypothetical protein
MSREKQIEERNELVDLLEDIGHDWDAYIDECQENEERPQLSYEDFHADAILEAGYRKQKVGEWLGIDDGVLIGDGKHLECSECGVWKKDRQRSNFCSSCGAKMKGGAE